jgi:prohibitin 1
MLEAFKRFWFWIDDHLVSATITVVVTAILVVVLWPMSVIFIPAGHVGVLWSRFFGGTVTGHYYAEGTRLILPWDIMNIYDARVQLIERDYDVLTADGLRSTINVAFRFRIDAEHVGSLHKVVGPDYLHSLVVPDVGSEARHIFARFQPEEAFTTYRSNIEEQIRQNVERNLLDNFNPPDEDHIRFFYIEDILIRGVQFPPAVADAIERKRVEYNRAQQYEFSIEAERREAVRKQIEAEGIRAFQDTIRDGLTDAYLRWRGIEATLALSRSPNSKVVVIGSGPGGLPIILGGMDGAAPSVPPAGPMSVPPLGTFDPTAGGPSRFREEGLSGTPPSPTAPAQSISPSTPPAPSPARSPASGTPPAPGSPPASRPPG